MSFMNWSWFFHLFRCVPKLLYPRFMYWNSIFKSLFHILYFTVYIWFWLILKIIYIFLINLSCKKLKISTITKKSEEKKSELQNNFNHLKSYASYHHFISLLIQSLRHHLLHLNMRTCLFWYIEVIFVTVIN